MIKLCAFADEYATEFDEQIKGLVKNGIKLIELRSADGKNVADFTDEDARLCRDKLADNGIKVWSVGSPIGKIDIDADFDEYEKTVRRVYETAVILGADKIRMFSFFNAYGKREKVIERLGRIVAIGGEYGVKAYHENEKDIYGDTVERVVDLMDSVKGLYHVYDPANFIQCGQDSRTAIETLFEREGYFHVKDVVKATGELVPAGYGDGLIDVILEKLKGRDAVMTLEPHLTLFTGYKAIDNTELKTKFHFGKTEEAFDFAVASMKALLERCGYKKTENGYKAD